MSRFYRKAAPWSPEDAGVASRRAPGPAGRGVVGAVFAGAGFVLSWGLLRVLSLVLVLVMGPALVVLMCWYAIRYGSPLGPGFRMVLDRGPLVSPPTEKESHA